MPDQPATLSAPTRTYRLSRTRNDGPYPKSHRHTLAAIEESSGSVLATCDVVGQVCTSGLEIRDGSQGRWRLTPNRSVLPTRWALEDDAGGVAIHFDQKVGHKLVNPLYRTALVVVDAVGNELLRLADTQSSTAERFLGLSQGDWALLRGDAVVGKLTRLESPAPAPRTWRGWLGNLLTTRDRGLVSFSGEHVLSAPAALAMLALFEELTDSSV